MAESRKLAAILAADVVGYSRLAGSDEDRTLARLRALRSDLIDPTIAVHHGRVADAVAELESSRRQVPSYITASLVLAACYTHMGRLADARATIARLRATSSDKRMRMNMFR